MLTSQMDCDGTSNECQSQRRDYLLPLLLKMVSIDLYDILTLPKRLSKTTSFMSESALSWILSVFKILYFVFHLRIS
jgi:hypothetical protein